MCRCYIYKIYNLIIRILDIVFWKIYVKLFLLLLLIITNFKELKAQTDTNFWFVAPRVTYKHDSLPIIIRLATSGKAADVTISEPANPGFKAIFNHMNANSTLFVDLSQYVKQVEDRPPDSIMNFGIYIRASNFITAYYDECSTLNPEIFALKGRNALGTKFYVSGQDFWNNSPSRDAYSAFDIVATEDNTTITIIPTNDIVGHAANVAFTKKLNKGQTYCARGISVQASGHLQGSYVSSDKPIAITISDDSATNSSYGGCQDLIGDQTVPVNVTGTRYIIGKGSLTHPDKIFITATEDLTDIYVNGSSSPIMTMPAGATFDYDINSVTYIVSSKPVYVYHVTGYGCEVGSAILPTIDCTGSTEISFVRSLPDHFDLILIVRTGGEGSFILNGNSNYIQASAFSAVPGTGGTWKAAKISFDTTQVPIKKASLIKNTKTKFGMGMITASGSSSGCSYGYFSDFKFRLHVKNARKLCVKDSLELTADTIEGATYQWTGPNGFSSTAQNPVIKNLTIANSGIYSVIAYQDSCPSETAEINVTVVPKLVINITPSNPKVCKGDSIKLNADGADYYSWSPGTGLSGSSGAQINASPSQTTTYTIKGTIESGCSTDTTLTIKVSNIQTKITKYKDKICSSDTLKISASPGGGIGTYKYQWTPTSENSSSIIIHNTSDTIKITNYKLQITDSLGCKESLTIPITFLQPIKWNSQSDSVCPDACTGTIIVKVRDSEGNPDNSGTSCKYSWSDKAIGSTNEAKGYLCAGSYIVTITDKNNCSTVSDSIRIIKIPIDTTHTITPITGYSPLSVDFNYNGSNKFSWNFGDSSAGNTSTERNVTHTYVYNSANSKNNTTSYTVKLIIENQGCTDTLEIKIDVKKHGKIDTVSNVLTANTKFGLTGNGLKSFELIIFNRWGGKVLNGQITVDSENSKLNGDEQTIYLWDGTNKNGSKVAAGAYFYIIKAKTMTDEILPERRGTVTIIK